MSVIPDSLSSDSLNFQILKADFQIQLDSIVQAKNTEMLEYKLSESINLMSDINEFYDSAWLKLIAAVTVLVVFVPFLIQFFQRKNNDALISNARTEFEKIVQEANISFEKKIENVKNEMAISDDITSAGMYMLQGMQHANQQKFDMAVQDFANSTLHYIKGNKYEHGAVGLESMVNMMKSWDVTKEEFKKALGRSKIEWEEFISDLSSKNDGRFRTEIKKLLSEFENLQ